MQVTASLGEEIHPVTAGEQDESALKQPVEGRGHAGVMPFPVKGVHCEERRWKVFTLDEYYPVVEHKLDSIKALFRRARDPKKAKKDFNAVMYINIKLVNTCNEYIAAIDVMEKI